jgi:hypothetical protein
MAEQAQGVGKMSGIYSFAEGWRKHNHQGFCSKNAKPLEDALNNYMHQNNFTRREV